MPKEEESEGRDGEEGKGEGEKYGENNNENLIKMQERLTIDDQHYSNCQQQEQKKGSIREISRFLILASVRHLPLSASHPFPLPHHIAAESWQFININDNFRNISILNFLRLPSTVTEFKLSNGPTDRQTNR